MLALVRGVGRDVAQNLGQWRGDGNIMVIVFYPFLMSIPLPNTAERAGRREEGMESGGRAQARGPALLQALMTTLPSDWSIHPHLTLEGMEVLSRSLRSPRSSHGSTDPCLCPSRYSEEEIRQKVGTFRQMLMEKEGVLTREDQHGRQM